MATANRKLESDLAERDFRESPVWRFVPNNEESEPAVEPCEESGLSLESGDTYLVAATAILASGESCPGFVRLGRVLGIVDEGPLTLFLNGRQCEIEASIPGWVGVTRVSASETLMLPIRWTATVSAAAEKRPRAGSVSSSRFVYFLKSTIRGIRLQGAQ